MSTPAATSVENVREKRAIVIFRSISQILIGSRSLKRSQLRRPCSVLRHFLKENVVPNPNARIRYQSALMKFDALRTHCVSVGSVPPRVRKTLLKNGTR